MAALTLDSMIEESETVMEGPSGSTFNFVSETRLAHLTTSEEDVERVLERRLGPNQNLPATTSNLAKFFSKKAFKVFAILATNYRFELMGHCYRIGFQNDMLPVKKRRLEDGSKGWVVESCYKKASNGTTAYEVFRSDSDGNSPWGRGPYLVNQFCDQWQWRFVPPVFVETTFRYKFPEQTCLPFTNVGEKKSSKDSLYSYVEEKSVHIDHLPRNLVR
jgi:hypothetical protein